MRKGEIALYEQFFLLSQYFQKTFTADTLKTREMVNPFHTMTPFASLGKKPIENIVGKGEIACTSNFSFSHIVFYSIKYRNYHFCYISFVVCKCFQFGLVQNLVMWEWVKGICPWDTSDTGLFAKGERRN